MSAPLPTLKAGEVAGAGPLTEIVYRPAPVTDEKSSAYTCAYRLFHEPRSAPTGAE